MNNNIQLSHKDHKPSANKFRLSLLTDNINNPANIGGLFRLCDALGVEKLYLCGDTITPPNAKINKSSRSTEKHVDFEYHNDATNIIEHLKTKKSFIISLEITSASMVLGSARFHESIANKESICLILGSEKTGIDQKSLDLSDITTHIPMYGNNSSMNVISAASIACFEIIKNL